MAYILSSDVDFGRRKTQVEIVPPFPGNVTVSPGDEAVFTCHAQGDGEPRIQVGFCSNVFCLSSMLSYVCQLFYSVLFYFILFYSVLFYSVLFYSVLFNSVLIYSVLFYSILFHSALFYSVQCYVSNFAFVLKLFCSTRLCSISVLTSSLTIINYELLRLQTESVACMRDDPVWGNHVSHAKH